MDQTAGETDLSKIGTVPDLSFGLANREPVFGNPRLSTEPFRELAKNTDRGQATMSALAKPYVRLPQNFVLQFC
jgi:hypothetical protein